MAVVNHGGRRRISGTQRSSADVRRRETEEVHLTRSSADLGQSPAVVATGNNMEILLAKILVVLVLALAASDAASTSRKRPRSDDGDVTTAGGNDDAMAADVISSVSLDRQPERRLGFGPLVLSPALVDAAASLANQPKSPVYHATPLQPYGSLLNHKLAGLEDHKPIVEEGAGDGGVTDDEISHPHQTQVLAPQHYAPAPQSYHNEALKVIPEPKYAPLVYKSNYEDEGDHHHGQYAARYQFGYQVRDQKSGSYFGHTEARDGKLTKGHYHVLLPDGRLQNVQYWADPSGYHAQVSYNGVAKHPIAASGHPHNHHQLVV